MDLATRSLINSAGLLVFGSVLTFIAARYWHLRNLAMTQAKEAELKSQAIAAEHQRVLLRINELEGKLALVNQAIVPISTAFQAILIKELTHFHTPEMDALLEKIGPPNTLTSEEQDRLSVLLSERTQDMGPAISESERDAAAILPIVIKRALTEAEIIRAAEAMKMQLVTVTAVMGLPHVQPREQVEPDVPQPVLAEIGMPVEPTRPVISAVARRATDTPDPSTKKEHSE